MLIPDTNLLVYAFNASSPFHHKAAAWWEEVVQGGELIGIPWVVLLAFVRLLSSRAVVADPYDIQSLARIVDEWFAFQHIRLLEASRTTYSYFSEYMTSLQLPGTLVTDAFIAASAREQRGVVCTNDSDFTRFPGIEVHNPIA